MSDVARLLGWFGSGLLLRPDPQAPGTVHLARALAALCGAPLQLAPPAQTIAAAIGESDHYVFVLADGLGLNLVDALPEDAFLRRHVAMPIVSVFPSSTAPSLTAFATGLWPAQHGVPGWHVYLSDRNIDTVTLPFVERFTNRPLDELGLRGEDLFATPVLWKHLKRDAAYFINRRIGDSVYTRYVSGGHPVLPYDSLEDAVDAVAARIADATSPTFTHLYYPAVDSAVHAYGPGSEQVAGEVAKLDAALGRLSESLAGRARLIVSADHGGYDVKLEQKLILQPEDELSQLLVTPPDGESPVPFFHVQPGHAAEFASRFRARTGDTYALLTADEVNDVRLLGPDPLSPTTRARIGDFIALAAHGEAVVNGPDTVLVNMKGFHGGLTPAEVHIPLVVA
jgi:predicted AlkP superfamily pyrophosphatase or phosphodiesterase